MNAKAWLQKLPLIACAVLFLWHLGVIYKHAVNVPYWDEWETFQQDALPSGLSLGWLLAQVNEHRILVGRLQIWALYHLDGWNLRHHQILNFLLL